MLSKIRITLTRDSVCLGDDVDDHTKIVNIALQDSSQKTIMQIAEKYLPHIMGNGHTWGCILNGKNVAVINANCKGITFYTNALTLSDLKQSLF